MTTGAPRNTYFRGGRQIDQRLTADALIRIADWLDLADSESKTAVYPALLRDQSGEDTSDAWMWAALLIADMVDFPTTALREWATGILGAYVE